MTPTSPDPARSIRHGVVYTAAVAVQGFSTLLVLPFALAVLGPAEYGEVAVALSIVQIGIVLAAAGLPLAITRSYFDHDRGLDRARAMAGLLCIVALATLVVAAVTLPLWASTVARGTAFATLLASLGSVGATAVVVGAQAILRAVGRPFAFAASALGCTAAAHVVALGFAQWDPRASVYMTGYLVGATVTAVAAVLVTRPRFPWSVPGTVGEGTRIGLPVLPHSLAMLVLVSADPLLVNRLAGTLEAGRYQAAMLLGLAPLSLLIGINNAWAPAVLGTPEHERARFLARSSVQIATVACVFTVGLALIAPIAVRILAHEQPGPDELSRIVQVIALSTLGYVAYLATSIVLFSAKRTLGLALVTPLCALAMLTLGYASLRAFGLPGMAAAKVAAFTLLALGTWIAARRLMRITWPYFRLAALGTGTTAITALLLLTPQTPVVMAVQFALACALGLTVVTVALVMGRSGRGLSIQRSVPGRQT